MKNRAHLAGSIPIELCYLEDESRELPHHLPHFSFCISQGQKEVAKEMFIVLSLG